VLLSMEIVVRTPHGDADVSIVSAPAGTTLGDVVAAVTGQAVPRLAHVDRHVVDATRLLDDAGLVAGSIVTSEPTTAPETSDADVELVQIAGYGAGRISRLRPGRYRIGPGRRSSADELTLAPVERAMFELVVERTGAASEVTVVTVVAEQPDATVDSVTDVLIDGIRVDGPTRWSNGTLSVGGRSFQFDSPARSDPPRTPSIPDRDGTVEFSRPPRRPPGAPRRPVVDAVRDATVAAPTLWERRPGHPDAFTLPVGVRDDDGRSEVVTIDLDTERAVAIAGSEHFRSALARTLVVELATLHGPADIDLVVLTDTDRLAHWDWAKWLPHLRLAGTPAIWSSAREIARWVDGAAERAASPPWISPHLTVAILDDPGLWSRRGSPLRSIVASPPDRLRLIALCDDPTHAPAICTTVVSENGSGLAQLQSFTQPDGSHELRPALTEHGVAVSVARSLAPLADVELPPTPPPPPSSSAGDRVDAPTLVGVGGPDDVEARWAAGSPRSAVPIGRRGSEPVSLDVSDDVTVILGTSIGDAFDVSAAWLLGQAADRSPDELWIAPVVRAGSERSAWWWRLPHATDPHELDVDVDVARLLARLRSVLADPDGPDRIVVVAEAAGASPTPDIASLDALGAGVRETAGLALVVVTDRAEIAAVGDTVVAVDQRAARGSSRHREAVITTGNGAPSPAFAPLQRSVSTSATLVVEPFVIGRALSPLERRIEQQRTRTVSGPDLALGPIVDVLRDAAARRPTRAANRTVLPPPLPTQVDLDELFDSSPGDGVPLGLLDDPAAAGARVLWWEPGDGSMLVFGSRRSGADHVLTTLLLGIIDRFSDLDVRLVVVEQSAPLRQAIAGIDRSIRIVDPDQAHDVADTLDEIDAELIRRTSGTDADGPRTVVLIDDLVQLRGHYADQALGPRIDDVLTRTTVASAGVDVVAWAVELGGGGPFAASATRRLVGASSHHDELRALGVERPGELDGVSGRCRSFPDGGLAQLATTGIPIETLLARRAIGETT
jgi:S-DNA-T family DNA segregation ATPase FtsK/SpoIIIE